MSALKCPYCGIAVSERGLSRHPPGEPRAKSVLPHTYCPSCGKEVRLSRDVPWWQAVFVLAAFALSFWLNHVAAGLASSPAYWVKVLANMLPFGVIYFLLYRARRLMPVQT